MRHGSPDDGDQAMDRGFDVGASAPARRGHFAATEALDLFVGDELSARPGPSRAPAARAAPCRLARARAYHRRRHGICVVADEGRHDDRVPDRVPPKHANYLVRAIWHRLASVLPACTRAPTIGGTLKLHAGRRGPPSSGLAWRMPTPRRGVGPDVETPVHGLMAPPRSLSRRPNGRTALAERAATAGGHTTYVQRSG